MVMKMKKGEKMSDLIRREDVKNLITMKPYDWSNITERRAMLLEIDKLPSAEPELKWIPISERLPKVRTDVLLAFEKNMAVGFYSHGCWNVNTGNGFYTGVFTDEDKPIAWMPLPEPAKIGDGK